MMLKIRSRSKKDHQPRRLFIPIIDAKFNSKSPSWLRDIDTDTEIWSVGRKNKQTKNFNSGSVLLRGLINSNVPLKIGGTNCRNKRYNREKRK